MFFRPSTTHLPALYFDPFTGQLEIKGKSTDENVKEHYSSLIKQIKNHGISHSDNLNCNIHLDSFNSSTSAYLLKLFKLLNSFKSNGHNIQINWYCAKNDELTLEIIEDFEAVSGLKLHTKDEKIWIPFF
jgi:hypothetical protein